MSWIFNDQTLPSLYLVTPFINILVTKINGEYDRERKNLLVIQKIVSTAITEKNMQSNVDNLHADIGDLRVRWSWNFSLFLYFFKVRLWDARLMRACYGLNYKLLHRNLYIFHDDEISNQPKFMKLRTCKQKGNSLGKPGTKTIKAGKISTMVWKAKILKMKCRGWASQMIPKGRTSGTVIKDKLIGTNLSAWEFRNHNPTFKFYFPSHHY